MRDPNVEVGIQYDYQIEAARTVQFLQVWFLDIHLFDLVLDEWATLVLVEIVVVARLVWVDPWCGFPVWEDAVSCCRAAAGLAVAYYGGMDFCDQQRSMLKMVFARLL